ncbi:DNA/RNA non-specific endonuclease [Staphylococcus epidermidis]|uniref:DNA/RNA non-specific endonuclease n=1 Tax=Staphylococcus epidermidis TaxID=1282 RepID=UPI003F49ABB0
MSALSKDIHYKTDDYNQESSTIQSINNVLKGKDFKDVDKIMENAQDDINSLDEDGVISLTHAPVGHKGAKLMGYYQDELYEYAKNLDAKMKEIIDTPFVDDLEKAIDGVSNVKLKNILIKNGGGKGNDTYGASGKIAKEGAKKGDSDVYSIDEILKSDKSFQKVIDQNYERMHKENKELKKSDFETYVTQGSSFDYITNKERAKIKAEQEKLKEQQKTETAVDVAATVGIVALTIVNPVAGTVAASAYTAYSVANAATGKNVITGRKMSKNERLMEGLLAIPLPGASFLKSTGKSMSKLAFTDSKKLAVKTGMHEGMQNMTSRMTPKMTAMKDSVLNQSKNFKQNNRVGQMLSNMRGQASNTVQQGKQWIGHQAQQVKQATNHILEKEIPFTQPRVAVAGVGSVQAGKGVTLREAGQSIQRTFSSNRQVTHTPKDSMVKSEGKHVSSGENKIPYNGQNKDKVQKMSKKTLKKLRRTTPSVEIRKEINKDLKNKLGQPDPAIPGKFITDTLEADHIVPFKEITKMDNIEKLSYDEIKEILNYRKNFIGLSKIANASKSSKSYQEWTVYRKENLPIKKKFREKMIEKENFLYDEIQQKINELAKGR